MSVKKLILEETPISTRGKLWCISGEVVQTKRGFDFHIHTFHEKSPTCKSSGRPDDLEGLERAVENFAEYISVYRNEWVDGKMPNEDKSLMVVEVIPEATK